MFRLQSELRIALEEMWTGWICGICIRFCKAYLDLALCLHVLQVYNLHVVAKPLDVAYDVTPVPHFKWSLSDAMQCCSAVYTILVIVSNLFRCLITVMAYFIKTMQSVSLCNCEWRTCFGP